MRDLLKKVGIDSLAVKEGDAVLERLALCAQRGKVLLGDSQLILRLAPSHKPAFAENDRVTEITAHRAADCRQQNKTDITAEAAIHSHDRHGITSRIRGQVNSLTLRPV